MKIKIVKIHNLIWRIKYPNILNLYDLKQTFISNLNYDPNIMNPNIIYLKERKKG